MRVYGFVIEDALDVVRAHTTDADKPGRIYRSFRAYPAREYLSALVWAADVAFPSLPLKEGVRRVARRGFLAIARTVPGRVVFGAFAQDINQGVLLVAKAFALGGPTSVATVVDVGDARVSVIVRPILALADTAVAGGFEGLLEAYGRTGTVSVTEQPGNAIRVDLCWNAVRASPASSGASGGPARPPP